MIHGSSVTIYLQFLSEKGDLIDLHGKLSGFVKKDPNLDRKQIIEIEELIK